MNFIGLVESIANNQPWTDRALCAQVDPEIFFPVRGGSTRGGKQVCSNCPVRAQDFGGTGECLQYALDRDERFGIWGGYSERERRRMKRETSAPVISKACGTVSGAHRHYKHAESLCQPCRFAVRAETASRRANNGGAA